MATVRDSVFNPKLTCRQISCMVPLGMMIDLEPGEQLFDEGEPEHHFYVVVDGRIQVTKLIGGKQTVLLEHTEGEFTGALSMFTGALSIASAHAMEKSRVLRIDVEGFKGTLTQCADIAITILSTMAIRLPEATLLVQQREKLASLGRMAAGLAHELNNPASAAKRASSQMSDVLARMQRHALDLGAVCLNAERREWLAGFEARCLKDLSCGTKLNTMERSDREEAIVEWLEEEGVDDPYEHAMAFVNAGIGPEDLDELRVQLGDAAVPHAVPWLSSTIQAEENLQSIAESSSRISSLVNSVKEYSYMDQAPRQDVDIRSGLESTLTMLGHKLKGITVTRDYAPELPRVPGFGSELNQVWTNLIDNAADALGGHGELTLQTRRDGDHVTVAVIDNGPGVPKEIQQRIFEPFFTTKPVGKGTGLGLDVAYRTVIDRHLGDMTLISQPGCTRFEVRLPFAAAPPEAVSVLAGAPELAGSRN